MIDFDIFQLEEKEKEPEKMKLSQAEAEEFIKNFKNQKGK